MNKLKLIKGDKIYRIDEAKKLEPPFDVVFKTHKLFTIKNKEDLIFFKRHMGVLNSSFHIVFYCIGSRSLNIKIFYHKESECIFYNDEQITKFAEDVFETYRRIRRWLQ